MWGNPDWPHKVSMHLKSFGGLYAKLFSNKFVEWYYSIKTRFRLLIRSRLDTYQMPPIVSPLPSPQLDGIGTSISVVLHHRLKESLLTPFWEGRVKQL